MRTIGMLAAAFAAPLVINASTRADEFQREVAISIDSGSVVNAGRVRDVVFSTLVHSPEAAWLRLRFEVAELGAAPAGGEPTILRLTSLFDAAVQTMNAEHLQQWQDTSAYFNGDALLVEIIADPGAEPSKLLASQAWASPASAALSRTICGPTDDRALSNDPRVARILPGRCSVWIINDANHCFLTAGHCDSYLINYGAVEFNVPLSSPSGEVQHPGPEDQYPVDLSSIQSSGSGGVGDDWAYFGCFENSQTGLTPYEAQGDYFVLATSLPPVQGQDIRITGFGSVSPPVPLEWNRVQKTHVGPLETATLNVVQYRTDTTSGNSGSPVIFEDTGEAIGVHSHGGCTSSGGRNSGTAITHPDLQWALANPQGVCIPQCAPDVNGDDVVDVADLLLVLAAWGPCAGCDEDINGDGVVDVQDLLELLAAWGPCP